MTERAARHAAVLAPEHRWPPIVAVIVALVLWLLLPGFFFGPYTWVAVAACALLVVPLVALNPSHLTRETQWSRVVSVVLSVLLLLFNQVLLVRLVYELLTAPEAEGIGVLVAALQLWTTNAIAFGLLYWDLELGGSVARRGAARDLTRADFQFPQDALPAFVSWRPRFVDYLYTSVTAGLAFSAADALPLSHRAKALMAIEAFSSYIIMVLVIARAVSAIS